MIHVENSITIDRPVGLVFGILGDPTRDPEWHFDVVEAAHASGDSPVNGNGHGTGNGPATNGLAPLKAGDKFRWVFDYMGQGREQATAEVTAVEPNRKVEILAIAGPLVQTISYVLEPSEDGGSKVFRTLDLDLEDMPAVAEPEMKPRIENRSQQYLVHLKQLLEEGKALPQGQNGCLCCEG
ncbi:MAG: SRPBCC family protein [Actinomycetota bacterium]